MSRDERHRSPKILALPLNDNHDDIDRVVRMERGNAGAITLTVPGRTIHHIERFWRRRCATDLWASGVFPNIKEVSEAESMRHAMVRRLDMDERSHSTLAIVVGDGRKPRLGALLAFTTGWTAVSIDPACDGDWGAVRRLTTIRERVENVTVEEIRTAAPDPLGRVVIAAPHSHARLDDAVTLARAAFPQAKRLEAVAMPCCVSQTIAERAHCDVRYEDLGVWSGKSVIQLWHGLHEHEEAGEEAR